MKRFLLLVLVVSVIVTALAYITSRSMTAQASPMPTGYGEAAWLYQVGAAEGEVPALIIADANSAYLQAL